MTLAFVFIDDFKIIKQKLFSFEPRFQFSINEEPPQSGNFQLSIRTNESYADIFPKRVTSITGLVGKNGSGKSSVLNCLKLMFGQLHMLTVPLIFGFYEQEESRIDIYHYDHGGAEHMRQLSLTISNHTDGKLQVNGPTPYSIQRLWVEPSVKGFDISSTDTACCHFSNIFDSSLEVLYENIHNISTNFKLEEFLKRHIKEEIEEDRQRKENKTKHIELWSSHLTNFFEQELIRQVKFIAYAETRDTTDLPPLPESIGLTFEHRDYQLLRINNGNGPLVDSNKIEVIQKLALNRITSINSQRENFFNYTILCSFFYALRNKLLSMNGYDLNGSKITYNDLIADPENIFEYLEAILRSDMKNAESKTKNIKRFLGKDFRNRLEKLTFIDGDIKNVAKQNFNINVDNHLLGVLKQVYEMYGFDDISFLKYNWRGLSTGEEALLTQYARLFEVREKITQKNLLLLIDEGDLYFHPQWQKEYIGRLLKFVPFIFPRKQIQFILTSHSPFIASDLPKQHLIFLKKSENQLTIVSDPIEHRETFGANIHDLFTDSFFLEDGLMGEFARRTI